MGDPFGFSDDTVSGVSTGASDVDMLQMGTFDMAFRGNGADAVSLFTCGFQKLTIYAYDYVTQRIERFVCGGEFNIDLRRNGDKVSSIDVGLYLPPLIACAPQNSSTCENNRYKLAARDGTGNFVSPTFVEDYALAMKEGRVSALEAQCGDTQEAFGVFFPDERQHWAHYVQKVGFAMFNQMTLMAATNLIENTWSDTLNAMSEFNAKPNKPNCGRRTWNFENRMQNIFHSMKGGMLYVNTGFYLNEAPSTAFVQTAMHFGTLSINFKTAEIENLIVVSDRKCQVLDRRSNRPVDDRSIRAVLEILFIQLDGPERKFLQSFNGFTWYKNMSRKFQSVRIEKAIMDITISDLRCLATSFFVGAIREKNQRAGSYFNYSGILGESPIKHMALKFDGKSRITVRPWEYFNSLIPWHNARSMPSEGLGMICFCAEPLHHENRGGTNLNKVSEIVLTVEFDSLLIGETVGLVVMPVQGNFLTTLNGSIFRSFVQS